MRNAVFTASVRTSEQLETVVREDMFEKFSCRMNYIKKYENKLKNDNRIVCVP
ncbi:MAG: hypothetical protein L6V93_08595 [Clostridiales bacterium]|nr:MAG: hypothetical protein L6V93_08595 [Clostridiales bacterium]